MSKARKAVPVQVEDTRALLNLLDLDDVYFLNLSVERADNSNDKDLQDGPRLEHQVFSQHDETTMSVRLQTTVEAVDAVYVVDVVTDYLSQVPYETGIDVRRDFIERVAVMSAWPYVRAAVSDLAARMRTEQIVLGLLRPGDISLGAAHESDTVVAADDNSHSESDA